MRLLYLSCHSILEHDEILLLNELGHYVFSPGAYVEPKNPGDATLRPALLNLEYDPDDVKAWKALQEAVGHDKDPKGLLTKDFVDRFDAVIVMHIPDWIIKNWEAIKHKKVIWRTIGQAIAHQELALQKYRAQGMKIIRYSPRENSIPNFCGSDVMIRFYKNPEEFSNWTGEDLRVITFNQAMKHRSAACSFDFYEKTTRDFPRGLYGPGNENIEFALGRQSFDELKRLMRSGRAYFYTGTHPASYTLNFIEAWMTGIPIVAIGPEHGNAKYFPGHHLYEIPDLITNGVNGFISDNPEELKSYIREVLNNETLARQISAAGRASAIEVFGKEPIKNAWRDFLNEI